MDSLTKTGLIYRLVAGVLFLGFVLVNTFFELGVTDEQPTGIEDKVHESLFQINRFFYDSKDFKNILIILSNIILDISAVFNAIIWLSFSKNFKLILSITIFFLIKLFTQWIFLVRPPNNHLIEYPGFPSIFYSYNVNNFFFFSATAGFDFILISEFFNNKEKIKFTKFFGILNIFNLFFFSFLSLTYYSLYTIDIMIGLITAHYSIRLSGFIHKYFDDKIFEDTSEIDIFEKIFGFLDNRYDRIENLSVNKNTTIKVSRNEEVEQKNDNLDVTNHEKITKENDVIYNDELI